MARTSKRQEIIDEAARLFGTKGFARTSMRDLAEATDMLPGSLYAHFRGKEELLYTIVDDANRTFMGAVGHVPAAPVPADVKLLAFCRCHMQVMLSHGHLHLVLLHAFRELDDKGRDFVVSKRNDYEAVCREVIESCLTEGIVAPETDSRLATRTLLSMLNWTYHWYDPSGPATPDDLATYFCKVIIDGHRGEAWTPPPGAYDALPPPAIPEAPPSAARIAIGPHPRKGSA